MHGVLRAVAPVLRVVLATLTGPHADSPVDALRPLIVRPAADEFNGRVAQRATVQTIELLMSPQLTILLPKPATLPYFRENAGATAQREGRRTTDQGGREIRKEDARHSTLSDGRSRRKLLQQSQPQP